MASNPQCDEIRSSNKREDVKVPFSPFGNHASISVGVLKTRVLDKREYQKELTRLQVEMVRLQEWIVQEGLKVVVLFDGRDTAGKGGVIRRITERTNPRVVRIVALGPPSDRERGVLALGQRRGA